MSFIMTVVVFFLWFFAGSYLLRTLKLKKSCGTTLLLIIIAIVGTAWTQKALDWYEEWEAYRAERAIEEQMRETQRAVMSFLEEMNPQLNKKVIEIGDELVRIDTNIQKLTELQQNFPENALIEKKLEQWQTLKNELRQVSQDIYQQVENAYVAYKIDEIQGLKKFDVLSEELLKEANAALVNAETTKSTIEEQLGD
jgi:hypothetical protein